MYEISDDKNLKIKEILWKYFGFYNPSFKSRARELSKMSRKHGFCLFISNIMRAIKLILLNLLKSNPPMRE